VRRRLLRALILLAVIAFVAGWFFTFRPSFLGGPVTYITVAGQSMKPTLLPGDLAIVREQRSYHTGQVVAFRIPRGQTGAGERVIHRIVGSDEQGYITRGDNRTGDDNWRPTNTDVIGALWIHVPLVGRYLPELRTPVILASLAAAMAVWVVLDWKRPPKATSESTD
jgi:signal peptidase